MKPKRKIRTLPDAEEVLEAMRAFPNRHITVGQRSRIVCKQTKDGRPQSFAINWSPMQTYCCAFCNTRLFGGVPIRQNERRFTSEDPKEDREAERTS
ncbi:MAG: hypothetical protein HYZ09_02760 [Candidatus Kerfeldbacteria bacterium]|nr:hypothetical protein [Candidatus Kerfeldbacteria bacterium]